MDNPVEPLTRTFLHEEVNLDNNQFTQLLSKAENLLDVLNNDVTKAINEIRNCKDDFLLLLFISLFHKRVKENDANPFALTETHDIAVIQAIRQISDNKILYFIASMSAPPRLRWEACLKIDDEDLLFQLALIEKSLWVYESIIDKLENEDYLTSLLIIAENKSIIRNKLRNRFHCSY